MKVLIIDDDEVNNFLCCKVMELSRFSSQIKDCTSVRQGLSYLKQVAGTSDYPEVLFLDINMPVETGWDFLDQFDQLNKDNTLDLLSIFMLSSSVYDDDISKANDHPLVSQYVTKPIEEGWLKNLKTELKAK